MVGIRAKTAFVQTEHVQMDHRRQPITAATNQKVRKLAPAIEMVKLEILLPESAERRNLKNIALTEQFLTRCGVVTGHHFARRGLEKTYI